jgi:hypothetical protein
MASKMVKWKNGSSCRSLTAVIGKQVFDLEISINDTNYLIPLRKYIVLI